MPKTSTANTKPPPSPMKMQTRRSSLCMPMTVQTRRSSLRSNISAEVSPKSESRTTMSADVKPLLVSPVKPGTGATAQPCMARSVVPVLAQHVRQSVKFWSSKSTAVEAAAVMMTSQPCCLDVVDAILKVLMPVRLCKLTASSFSQFYYICQARHSKSVSVVLSPTCCCKFRVSTLFNVFSQLNHLNML